MSEQLHFAQMTEDTQRGGYTYYVSDEDLKRYGELSMEDRLRWVDELRLFILETETPETRERRERLRRGETIV